VSRFSVSVNLECNSPLCCQDDLEVIGQEVGNVRASTTSGVNGLGDRRATGQEVLGGGQRSIFDRWTEC